MSERPTLFSATFGISQKVCLCTKCGGEGKPSSRIVTLRVRAWVVRLRVWPCRGEGLPLPHQGRRRRRFMPEKAYRSFWDRLFSPSPAESESSRQEDPGPEYHALDLGTVSYSATIMDRLWVEVRKRRNQGSFLSQVQAGKQAGIEILHLASNISDVSLILNIPFEVAAQCSRDNQEPCEGLLTSRLNQAKPASLPGSFAWYWGEEGESLLYYQETGDK